MKKRVLSMFLCFCMALVMLPTTAWAIEPSAAISIGGVTVDSSDWYAVTDTSGKVTLADASGDWTVHVVISGTTATVTLKEATIENPSYEAPAIKTSGYDLNIVLEGTANQIGTDKTSAGDAIYSSGRNVSINGEGNLTIKGNYGINVNGSGNNVGIDMNGSLSVESTWQMFNNNGSLTINAKSMDIAGYYIACNSASLTATDGDIELICSGNYGISVNDGDVTVSAPKGAVSLSGNGYAVYKGKNTAISAPNNITVTGTVESKDVSIHSETGDITINGHYQAIRNAQNSVELSAPQGDISLTADNWSNIISGSSSYPLTITAGGALDAKGPYGISSYSTAVIKAENVQVRLTDAGGAFSGASLSITNPEGDNCSKVSVSGGGGGDTIRGSDLTIKANQVLIAADDDATNAIHASGTVMIGDAGMIVGAISISGTNNISPNIVQMNQNSGDISTSGLDISTPPTETKFYSSGDGYALFTPVSGETPATLTLHNASSGALTLPEHAIVNTTADSTINGGISPASSAPCDLTFSGTGKLTVDGSINNAQGGTMTVSGGADVTVNGSVNIGTSGGADGTLNVTGVGTTLNVSSSSGYAVLFETVNLANGASLTANAQGADSVGVEALSGGVHVTGGSTLTTGCDYGVYITDGKLELDNSSKLITNGTVAPFCIVDKTSAKSQSDVLAFSGIVLPNDTKISSVKGTDSGYGYTYWSLAPTSGGNLTVSNENKTIATLMGAKTGTLTFVKAASTGGSSGGSGGSTSTVSYKLSFETNGGSKISDVSKENGTTLEITSSKPTREGYAFDGWYADKALTEKVTSIKLTKNMTVYAKWTEKAAAVVNPFTDVSEKAYYHDAVLWAMEKNITSGTTNRTFSPEIICTRAQMVTFLWRAMDAPEPTSTSCPFTDVAKDSYYYKAVLWAVEKGITAGDTQTTFSPDATVTRGQAVIFMWRAAGKPTVTASNSFTDVSKDAYYYNAMLWAVEKGITQGNSEVTFNPSGSCNRSQIVTFLYRYAGK